MIQVNCECGSNVNNVKQDTVYGFSSKLCIECANCSKVLGSFHTSSMSNNIVDVNSRLVNTFDSLRLGYAVMGKFFQSMNMHCMSSNILC